MSAADKACHERRRQHLIERDIENTIAGLQCSDNTLAWPTIRDLDGSTVGACDCQTLMQIAG